MGANAIGAGSPENVYSGMMGGVGGSSATDIKSTIERLKNQREKLDRQTAEGNSRAADRKKDELDKRINNLQKRLDKLNEDDGECQTCENRKYQDVSDDSGVSFQNATKISSGAEEAAVRGHEYEHVSRNQAKADRENRKVLYQTVVIKHATCPECGRVYVAGGETRTVTRSKPPEPDPAQQLQNRFKVGMNDTQAMYGQLLNIVA